MTEVIERVGTPQVTHGLLYIPHGVSPLPYVGILQTKFSYGEGHEARCVGLEAMPLAQAIVSVNSGDMFGTDVNSYTPLSRPTTPLASVTEVMLREHRLLGRPTP